MTQSPTWEELSKLHVVRNVTKLLGRRWNLSVGLAAATGGRAPEASEFAKGCSLCTVIQGSPEGKAACISSGSRLLGTFTGEDASVQSQQCHAGLLELAAPIHVGGECTAALVCGGYIKETEGLPRAMARIDRLTASFSLPAEDYRRAKEIQPTLSKGEESFIGELLRGAADEITSYLGQSGRGLLPAEGGTRERLDDIVGGSEPMQKLYSVLDRVVASDTTVLVQGENGTGKELVARAIHRLSRRKNERFVVQNCSAFNDNLLDSELFGHKRGAFTGAVSDKPGLFEVADKGTFFLDEIGDMSPALQVKVLRVLQEGTFTPVGDTVEKRVDVRIIAATNRDLKAMVASGEFREDLYYRINVINIVIPPLRERYGDIPLLAHTFLRKHARGAQDPKTLTEDAIAALETHPWRGNVRELQNEIERAVVMSGENDVIEAEDLSERILAAKAQAQSMPDLESMSLPVALQTLERRMILAALGRNKWNKTRAAAELDISRRNLIRLVKKYELEKERPQ